MEHFGVNPGTVVAAHHYVGETDSNWQLHRFVDNVGGLQGSNSSGALAPFHGPPSFHMQVLSN